MFNIIQYYFLRYTPLFFILMGYSLMVSIHMIDTYGMDITIIKVCTTIFCIIFIKGNYDLIYNDRHITGGK